MKAAAQLACTDTVQHMAEQVAAILPTWQGDGTERLC
jgi:hypothetical protein